MKNGTCGDGVMGGGARDGSVARAGGHPDLTVSVFVRGGFARELGGYAGEAGRGSLFESVEEIIRSLYPGASVSVREAALLDGDWDVQIGEMGQDRMGEANRDDLERRLRSVIGEAIGQSRRPRDTSNRTAAPAERKRQKAGEPFMRESSHHASAALESAQAARASAESIADALKVSELRYRRLFETARDGILLLDSEHGRITDANPFMTELLGYSHDELLGKELWEIGLLRDKDASREAFRRLERDGYIRYEDLPLENRRGQRREVEFVSNLYRENGHTVIQCNIRDITERHRTEAALAAAAAKNGRIAETLQRSMLQTAPSGRFPGMTVMTHYAAALREADVGGDFFDAFDLSGDRVALVVGDVSGKGLSAAGRTAEVKYALRAFLHAYPAPADALAHLNDFVCETHRLDTDNEEAFIVLAVAVVYPSDGETVFTAAGAESTLILRGDGLAEPVETCGRPLGIESGAVYASQVRRLAPGETVLMATDGITEARQGRAFLGVGGMAALAEKAGASSPLVGLSRAIYEGARDYAGGSLHDDVCLLLARRL